MSGGGVPANTSSTTTVNQSPWQNKTYRTLALGTPENLGPVAQQLKIGQQLTKDWMDIQSGRDPGLYYGLQNATPERVAQEAAMRDVGFAAGRVPMGAPEAVAAAAPQEQAQPQAAAEGGIMSLQRFATGKQPKANPKPKPEQLAQPDADKNEYGFTSSQQAQWDNLEKLRNSGKKMTQQQIKSYNDLKGIRIAPKANAQGKAPFSYSDLATPTAFLDQATGQNMLADAQLAYQKARELGTPEQIGQATQAYQSAISGLQGVANYQPQNVTGASINRGSVRDINAIMADVEKYKAAGMQAPPALQAEAYQAAQMQGAQMQGPEQWTARTAKEYMDPYQQAVINQSKYESNRNFLQNLNALRGGAAKSKAFGGTRQAMQEAEALRNQGYTLEDIQNKGMSQAYQQGLQQFNTAQGQGLQAGQANLQANLTTQQQNQAALNAQQQLYVQQALDAAKTSYGGELTAAQQNQIAQNAARQFNAQAQNTAYNNYSAQQLAAQQANQGMDWNVASQNATMAQQAALANQQAGLQANQQNIGAYGAMGGMAQGLGGLGATQNQIQLNNLGALGQSATAQTNYAQGALDRQTQNAINYFNLPTTFNAAGINALNAQPVSGGTNQSSQWYNQARPFAKGGKVKWGPKK